MKTLFNRFANDESGATAIEYGLSAALIRSRSPGARSVDHARAGFIVRRAGGRSTLASGWPVYPPLRERR